MSATVNATIGYATAGSVLLLIAACLAEALWRANRTPPSPDGAMTWPGLAMLPVLLATWVASLGMVAGGAIGAVGLGGVALVYCLSAGLLGLLAALFVVPLALFLGGAAGAVLGGGGILFGAAYGLGWLLRAIF